MAQPQNASVLTTTQRSGPCPFEPADALNAVREEDGLSELSGRHPLFGPFSGRAPCSTGRIELRAALSALLRRFPAVRLAVPFEEVPFRVLSPVYGLKSLPLTW